jgi:hypothetical protein
MTPGKQPFEIRHGTNLPVLLFSTCVHINTMLLVLCVGLFMNVHLSSEESPILSVLLTWNEDPTSSMVVQWITKADHKTCSFHYQLEDETDWKPEATASVTFPSSSEYALHKVSLSGLQAGSIYRFQIDNSLEHLFATMPSTIDAPISFVVGGDINLSNPKFFEETNRQIAWHNPSFAVIGGDLAALTFQKQHLKEDIQNMLLWCSIWYHTMRSENDLLIPVVATLGNHDVDGGYGQLPEKAPFFYLIFGSDGYKTLRFGNYLSIYLLDSGHTHPVEGVQTAWLAQELEKDWAYDHRFAIYHVPAYPSVKPFRSKRSELIRRYWVPIFDTYKLHIAFENHDHAYKRTFPLRDGKQVEHGVVYIGDGSWGVKPRIPKNADKSSYLAKTMSARQFCKVQLTPLSREVWAIASDGTIIDYLRQSTDDMVAKEKKAPLSAIRREGESFR